MPFSTQRTAHPRFRPSRRKWLDVGHCREGAWTWTLEVVHWKMSSVHVKSRLVSGKARTKAAVFGSVTARKRARVTWMAEQVIAVGIGERLVPGLLLAPLR